MDCCGLFWDFLGAGSTDGMWCVKLHRFPGNPSGNQSRWFHNYWCSPVGPAPRRCPMTCRSNSCRGICRIKRLVCLITVRCRSWQWDSTFSSVIFKFSLDVIREKQRLDTWLNFRWKRIEPNPFNLLNNAIIVNGISIWNRQYEPKRTRKSQMLEKRRKRSVFTGTWAKIREHHPAIPCFYSTGDITERARPRHLPAAPTRAVCLRRSPVVPARAGRPW